MSTILLPEQKITVRTPVSAHVEPQARTHRGAGEPTRPAGPPARRPSFSSTSGRRFASGGTGRSSRRSRTCPFRVERAEIYGVLGANRSGKSTLVRLVSTLLKLDTGHAEVFGHDVERDEMAVKLLINRVSVDAAFFKKLSPFENLAFAARLYGLHAGEARREAIRILARLGISEKRMGSPIDQMSRGMQQKVAIARALLTSPTLLLLDEPTTGLDPRSKLEVQSFVEGIRAPHDATILLTTHDMAEADRLCDRIAILDGGRLVAEDTPAGLKARVARETGLAPTLDNVFMTYTDRSLDEDVEPGAPEDDE